MEQYESGIVETVPDDIKLLLVGGKLILRLIIFIFTDSSQDVFSAKEKEYLLEQVVAYETQLINFRF